MGQKSKKSTKAAQIHCPKQTGGGKTSCARIRSQDQKEEKPMLNGENPPRRQKWADGAPVYASSGRDRKTSMKVQPEDAGGGKRAVSLAGTHSQHQRGFPRTERDSGSKGSNRFESPSRAEKICSQQQVGKRKQGGKVFGGKTTNRKGKKKKTWFTRPELRPSGEHTVRERGKIKPQSEKEDRREKGGKNSGRRKGRRFSSRGWSAFDKGGKGRMGRGKPNRRCGSRGQK